jgi:hypothetical protein
MIAITTKINSEYLKIPELLDFFGKEVTITISENINKKKLKHVFYGAGQIFIDENEILKLREQSMI